MKPDINLIRGDCLEVMSLLKDHSIDCILADMPYGTTQNHWDSVLPLDQIWMQYKRLIKPHGAIVLFSSQPFTTTLISSNLPWFKYCWVWDKISPVDFLNVKRRPMRQHEDIVVFRDGQGIYNPQLSPDDSFHFARHAPSASSNYGTYSAIHAKEFIGYPRDIIRFRRFQPVFGDGQTSHPTQKPVDLLAYLIRTYTHAGDYILDNTMGSGSTMIACIHTGRNGIGIELDATYYERASSRVNTALQDVKV